MMPFKVGDRVSSKHNDTWKGTVVSSGGIICRVRWDGEKHATEHYHRTLRLLNPNEDGAQPGSAILTINEQAHGHE